MIQAKKDLLNARIASINSEGMDETKTNQYLSTMNQDSISLKARIAILCWGGEKASHKFTEKAIILFEYAQLMAIDFLTNYKSLQDKDIYEYQLGKVGFFFARMLSPGNLLPFEEGNVPLLLTLLFLALLFFLFRLALLLYIIWKAYKRKEPSKLLLSTWRWIFKFQVRILYLFNTSIWMNVLQAILQHNTFLTSGEKNFLMVLSTVILIFEFIFTIFIHVQYTGVLPSKSLLASKDNIVESITFIQKFMIEFFRRFRFINNTFAYWSSTISSCFFGLFRIRHFFIHLPAYQIDTLFYQANLLAAASSLNFAALGQIIFLNYPLYLNFTLISWVVLAIIAIKVLREYLYKRLQRVIFVKKGLSAEALVHKMILIKHIVRTRTYSSEFSAKYDLNNMTMASIIQNSQKILNVNLTDITEDNSQGSKRIWDENLTSYLDSLLKQFPHNDFLKLYAAYYKAHTQKLYGSCLKILSEIKPSSSPKIRISVGLIKHAISKKIQSDYQNNKCKLDLFQYLTCTSSLARLKLNMACQAKAQAEICKEISGKQPNLLRILMMGKQVESYKTNIAKHINKYLEEFPDYYMEPYLAYAYYHLLVTFNHPLYKDYFEMYLKKLAKYEKALKAEDLCQENLYESKNNTVLLFSADKQHNGSIVEMTENSKELFGHDLTGKHVSECFIPFARVSSQVLMKLLLGELGFKIIDQFRTELLLHAQNYMIPVHAHLNINPEISKGLTYFIVIRRIKSSKESILINEDGDIETFTKGIGHKLGLLSSTKGYDPKNKVNIKLFSPDLFEAHRAFNTVYSAKNAEEENENPKAVDMMNLEEAQNICSTYTTFGKLINLKPRLQNNDILRPYNCKISEFVVNTKMGKLITLERYRKSQDKNDAAQTERTANTRDFRKGRTRLTEVEEESVTNSETELEAAAIELEGENNNAEEVIPFEKIPSSITKRQATALVNPTTHRTEDHTSRPLLSQGSAKRPQYAKSPLESPKKPLIQPNDSANSSNHNSLINPFELEWLTPASIKKTKGLERAVLENYVPVFYRTATILLAALLITKIVLQGRLMSTNQEKLQELDVSKEILHSSQAIKNHLIELGAVVRYLNYYAEGNNAIFAFPEAPTTNTLLQHALFIIEEMKTANLDMVLAISSLLDSDDRNGLFESDIDILEARNETRSQMSSFQAIEHISESTLKGLSLFQDDPISATQYFEFVIYNTKNGVLIRFEDIEEKLSDNIISTKKGFFEWKQKYMLIMIALLILLLSGFAFLVYSQYSHQSRNMYAFIKLNQSAISNIKTTLGIFQDVMRTTNIELLEDSAMKQKAIDSLSQALRPKNLVAADHIDLQHQPNYLNLQRYFMFTLLQLSALVLVLLGLVILNYTTSRSTLNNIATTTVQINFLDEANYELSLTSGSLVELTATNGEAFIKNELVTDIIETQFTVLENIQAKFTSIFQLNDVDPDIYSLLYVDVCQDSENQSAARAYCETFSKDQNKFGYVNLFNTFEANYEAIYQKFGTKSNTALAVDIFEQTSIPIITLVKPVSDKMQKVLNMNFTELSDSNEASNIRINIAILVILVVGSLVTSLVVRNRLQNQEKQFRRLLLIFPANLVLSNFMLKSYLMRTSKETLEFLQDYV